MNGVKVLRGTKEMKGFVSSRVLPWLIIIVMGAVMFVFPDLNPLANIIGIRTSTNHTSVTHSIEQVGELILLKLGNVDFFTEETAAYLPWLDIRIAGTRSSTIIRGEYIAQLGIDGSAVEIVESPESITVYIPPFQGKGFREPNFSLVSEQNGLLSFLSDDIDQLEMVNYILNEERMEGHLVRYEEFLRTSAENFYRNLIQSIDSEREIIFVFNHQ